MTAVRRATLNDAENISTLAVETFGLACPPDMAQTDIEAFCRDNLSPARFEAHLSDPTRMLLVVEDAGMIAGYTLLIDAPPSDPLVDEAVTARPAVELNKVYVRSRSHGSGQAGTLMRATLETAVGHGARGVWLGVNQLNARAVRFYEKSGFTVVGTRRFKVGARWCDDFVMQSVLRD
ncbi:GNAT family N-acetyltransferase [Paramicrobacterium agarici]|uniref:Ribosomal protein S18 acetylase RimI-like enzyme n=1 Tax=Paramicrobacterium agarici TaxID=630514 RepID=A0A2A9DQY9_9MICO|nr:GNAT family N-acetyltransferase [Microbacterium agarici]PFG29177.1 ribosomal protein S18 acetylase RimI-like enzyme [Microbacterium agarici]